MMDRAVHNWYKLARWQKMRKAQLAKEPYCQCRACEGKKVLATVADHIKPHRGDRRLFWDRKNLQSLSGPCHSGWKQQIEKSGFEKGCREDGLPYDEGHLWNNSGV